DAVPAAVPAAAAAWLTIQPADRRARAIADPVAGAGTAARGAVAGVREPAAVEGEAAAADALPQPAAEPLELRDPLVDPGHPGPGEPCPVAPARHAVRVELGELGADLVERQADPLRKDDEGDAPEDVARVAPLPAVTALGSDQAALLVEAERRGG